VWHPFLIPGLLQEAGYARELFTATGESEDQVEKHVALRVERQQILSRPDPSMLLAVLDESALHRHPGAPEIMHRQLMHLLEQGQRSHIGIQVVPTRCWYDAGCVGGLSIASVSGTPDVLLSDAVEDVTTAHADPLRRAHAIFDRVRLVALPKIDSLELIA